MDATETQNAVKLALEVLAKFRAGELERHQAKALLQVLGIGVSLDDPHAPRAA